MKKLLSLALVAALSLVAALPASAANVRFACAADADNPRPTLFSAPTQAPEALPMYQAGDVVVLVSLNGGESAVRVTGPGVTVYQLRTGARETRYPCKRIDPASIPPTLRTQPRPG